MIACLAMIVSAAAFVPVDHDRLVDAIRAREGWRGHDGAAGERGPWQIRASVWSMHMPGKPFALARQEAPARACALQHLRWLAQQLERRGVTATPFNLAASWNAGLEGYTSGKAPVRAYLFAGDVEALYAVKGGSIRADTARGERGQKTLKSPAATIRTSRGGFGGFASISFPGSVNLPARCAPAFEVSAGPVSPASVSNRRGLHLRKVSTADAENAGPIQVVSAINQAPARAL